MGYPHLELLKFSLSIDMSLKPPDSTVLSIYKVKHV